MQTAIDQFRTSIRHVRNLGAIYKAIRAQTTDILDLSDVLRAELVLAVSALDHYVHEIVRLGMLEIYRGSRAPTPTFLKFSVSLSSVLQGIAAPASDIWLEDEIRARQGWQSFQHATRVAEAIRLVGHAANNWC